MIPSKQILESPATPGKGAKIRKGYRFKLVHPLDRFPDFIVSAGATGTVITVEPTIWAKMDRPIPGAQAWNNELFWETLEQFVQDTEPCP